MPQRGPRSQVPPEAGEAAEAEAEKPVPVSGPSGVLDPTGAHNRAGQRLVRGENRAGGPRADSRRQPGGHAEPGRLMA